MKSSEINIRDPFVLFSASEAKPFVKKVFLFNYITDGPYLLRTEDGRLHLLWSTMADTGYVEAIAHSVNNEIDGNWKVEEELLYDHDGGHGMIFRDLNGQYQMTLHYPNTFRKEHPIFLPLEYKDGFVLKQE